MSDKECCRDKLSQFKIGGPSKPYVDENLQLHLPECDSSSTHPSRSPIYSHYVGSSPSYSIPMQINEAEFRHAMDEANASYTAWKKLQQRIHEAIQNLKTK